MLFNSYCYTDKPIHPEATVVHGISKETVDNAPKWSELWYEIRDILKDRVIIAHNAIFDVKKIISTCKRYNIDIDFDLKYLCTMEHPNSKYQISRKLSSVISILGMDFNEKDLHESLFDCQGCLYIINPKNPIFGLRQKAKKYYNILCSYDTGESPLARKKKGLEWLSNNFNITDKDFDTINSSTALGIVSKLEPFLLKRELI